MLNELWMGLRYVRARQGSKIISWTAVISMLGVAVGVAVLIVVIAVMSGFDRFLQDKMIGTNSHMFIEFFNGCFSPGPVMERLEKLPHIQAAAPLVSGQAFIRQDSLVVGVELRGIDPVLQRKISKIGEYLKKGSLDLVGNEVVVGSELADKLSLSLGDKISLVSPMTLLPVDFLVKGIFQSGMYLYDAGLLVTSIKGAQDFLGLGNQINSIGISVDDVYRVDSVKKEIYRNIKDIGFYDVRTWVDANKNFLSALKLEKIVMFIVVTMTTVVAAFGIISTLMMSIMSKMRDIGILRAVGAKTASILQIFVYQGIFIGGMGILLGFIGGVSFTLSLNRIVDFISRMIGKSLIPKDIYYFDKIPTYVTAWDISAIVISAFIICLGASIYPASFASRVGICEALRNE